MQLFQWKPQFDTGIDTVDQQHRQLVDLINRLGTVAVVGQNMEATISPILGELTDYAFNHFSEEEDLMENRGVDQRHIEHHQRQHSRFIEQVEEIWNLRGSQQDPIGILGDFLSSWLTSHILEEDQSMARQMALIQSGMSADAAYRSEQHDK
ncbi:MAG: bacteriohemerythrin [Proteobacteria bacterium]|nr:bacteriohemerythrin [Pseudomonadota bacterium]